MRLDVHRCIRAFACAPAQACAYLCSGSPQYVYCRCLYVVLLCLILSHSVYVFFVCVCLTFVKQQTVCFVVSLCWFVPGPRNDLAQAGLGAGPSVFTCPAASTPNLPTKIIPTKIAWLKTSGEFPMGMYIPPPNLRFCLSQTLWNPGS